MFSGWDQVAFSDKEESEILQHGLDGLQSLPSLGGDGRSRFEWCRGKSSVDMVEIVGAVGRSYTLQRDDVGAWIGCRCASVALSEELVQSSTSVAVDGSLGVVEPANPYVTDLQIRGDAVTGSTLRVHVVYHGGW